MLPIYAIPERHSLCFSWTVDSFVWCRTKCELIRRNNFVYFIISEIEMILKGEGALQQIFFNTDSALE